jgi:hemin uptake protein HemP
VTESAKDSSSVPPVSEGAPQSARLASSELFRGRRQVVIVHRGHEYRLFITKSDKLILTK